jgi:hypothetical protein
MWTARSHIRRRSRADGWRTRAKQFLAYVLLAIVDPRVSRGLNRD